MIIYISVASFRGQSFSRSLVWRFGSENSSSVFYVALFLKHMETTQSPFLSPFHRLYVESQGPMLFLVLMLTTELNLSRFIVEWPLCNRFWSGRSAKARCGML